MAKKRTQLYLDERQREALAREAERTGKSLGQLVREAVDQVYGTRGREAALEESDSLWNSVGAGESGGSDVSVRHDEYLYE